VSVAFQIELQLPSIIVGARFLDLSRETIWVFTSFTLATIGKFVGFHRVWFRSLW